MKRILAALAGLALTVGVANVASATHNTDHKGYSSPCGDHSSHNAKPGDTTVYQTDSAAQRKGHAGVTGPRGYIEAGGDASGTTPTGAIHGTTANNEFYGHVGDDRVCVGSGGTKQNVDL